MALNTILSQLFKRDLQRLKSEIEAYNSEANLWIVDKEISNSGGNLCLHLVGNLNAYIGTELGKTGYVRKRSLEFSSKDIPRTAMLAQVDDTIEMIESVLSQMTPAQFNEDFPLIVFKEKMTNEFFLLHLLGHLNYHLGQINYHRRLLD